MFELLGNLFGAIKEIFGFKNKKLDLNNQKDIKDSKIKQNKQNNLDEINKNIKEQDIEEIRKKLG